MSPTVLQQKRHQQILTDVVRAYIETGEPVSSRSIAHRHVEPLSPATVRNVMADLEEEGFLLSAAHFGGARPHGGGLSLFCGASGGAGDGQPGRPPVDSPRT